MTTSTPLPAPLTRHQVLTSQEQAVATLLPLLQQHQSFLVTSHARPDGDAVGSSLAAMHLLQAMGKQVTVALADPVPRTFVRLPGTAKVVRTQPATPCDVALILECDSVERTGFPSLAASLLINIDHHRSGTAYADVNWIDPEAPAVGSMLFQLALAAGVPLPPELATCLYAALITDTVQFTLPSADAGAFAVAQQLIEFGADAAGVSEAVYHSWPPTRLYALSAALRRFRQQGAVAWASITADEIHEAGAEIEDCEGVVNYVVGVEGVRAGVFLRELPSGHFRASLRSKGAVDVASVAETLGGGGHRNASGCTVDGPLDRAIAEITAHLQRACTQAQLP